MPIPALLANPMFQSALLNLGGGVIGGLFGRDRERKQRRAEQRHRREYMRLSSPGYLANLQRQHLGMLTSGPGFTQALSGAAAAGNRLTSNLARGLGQSGLQGTGIGALTKSVGGAVSQQGRGGILTAADLAALQSARGQQSDELSFLAQRGPYAPSQGMQMGIGGGIQDALQLFSQFLPQDGTGIGMYGGDPPPVRGPAWGRQK